MCKERFLLALFMFVMILTVTACNVNIVKGSGDVITETRQVSNFDSISVSGSGQVVVTQDGNESLSIETDDNVMKHVKAEVDGGTLKLGFGDGINIISASRLVFYVSVDDLAGLSVSGSGDVESDFIESELLDTSVSGSGGITITDSRAGRVKADISGSGEISVAGEADSQEVELSGAGNYQAGNLCSASVMVSVSGSGDATVCAEKTLDASTSGSGSVRYYGRPTINSSDSGSGKIVSLGEK